MAMSPVWPAYHRQCVQSFAEGLLVKYNSHHILNRQKEQDEIIPLILNFGLSFRTLRPEDTPQNLDIHKY